MRKLEHVERRVSKRPVVGVGAVVFNGQQVLLVRRAKAPGQGSWSLPGGKLEWGESLAQAVRREVLEETGLEVKVGPLLEVLEAMMPDPTGGVAYHYILFDYVCWADNQAPVAASDASQAAWFGLEECRDLGMWAETMRIIDKGWPYRKGA